MALGLLTFLVLLVLGLAALTSIESGTVTTNRSQIQAREYALLAHGLALAQLQRLAGPDQRVTATAESVAGSRHPHWTGVWHSGERGPGPMSWLVSGGENSHSPALATVELMPAEYAELVGQNSSGQAREVVAPLQTATVASVPGAPVGNRTAIGRYAWWVGDQGVKAPVAAAGRSEEREGQWFGGGGAPFPFDPVLSSGAGAADAAGYPVFEARAGANASLAVADRLVSFLQIAMVRDSADHPLGLIRLREHFHAWSPNNQAVLANSRRGGLRQDLSLVPGLLGEAFSAWANSRDYFEAPIATGPVETPGILPAYGPIPLRRRHRIGAPITAAGLVFTRAPVLSLFFLQFNVRRVGGNSAPATSSALEVRARMVVQLWNPWTSALVPEPLRLEVTGLPEILVEDSNGGRSVISLSGLFGRPMKVELTPADVAFPGDPDEVSWLPGRVYAWRSKGGSPAEWKTEFYNRTLSVPNANVWVVPAGVSYAAPAANSVRLVVRAPAAQLSVALKTSAGATLSTTHSPPYAAFSATPQRVNANDEYRFGFPMRMVDPIDLVAAGNAAGWLTGMGLDPRATNPGEPLIRAGSGGDLPGAYVGVGGNSVFTDENRLLDRVMGRTGMSYNEDVPVFELPRSPPLSLGQLQHLQVSGARPFSIGNSWGASASVGDIPAGELFDRFFLSGLSPESSPGTADEALLLPNPRLRASSRRDANGNRISGASLRTAPAGRSSKFLLQGGAFNINSTNVAAWVAVLRSGRILAPHTFSYLDASAVTGTAGDHEVAALPPAGAAFFRFPHSAREVAKADPGYAASPKVPPNEPDVPSLANTHLFRRGVRTLTPDELVALARAIVRAIGDWQVRFGPFRSLEDFLAPHPLFENRSALEHALAEAGTNANVAEFSSQWLTPADILTTLAPVLFPRSDTFMIRSYGEATNPVTGAAEGRAWCESIVQRMPEYCDPAGDDATTLPDDLTSPYNRTHGRRFKVVSFRWLNRSDI